LTQQQFDLLSTLELKELANGLKITAKHNRAPRIETREGTNK